MMDGKCDREASDPLMHQKGVN